MHASIVLTHHSEKRVGGSREPVQYSSVAVTEFEGIHGS